MKPDFPTDYSKIEQRFKNFDPTESYQETRNYVDGDVSYLSPYITHGVLPLRRVFTYYFKNFELTSAYKFLQELTWREFFQRVWWNKGDDIFTDVRREQPEVNNEKIPKPILEANTKIKAIDQQIEQLYDTGYVHNHARMWIASLVCNFAKSYWQLPSKWFYYHLLDGDPASNMLNWQWVAGSFSHKKYWFNQWNVNKYSKIKQQDTFLDMSYDEIKNYEYNLPDEYSNLKQPDLKTPLPESDEIKLDEDKPLLLYHNFSLDPLWHEDKDANRILVLEPSHFEKLPVSENVMNFILDLAKNIEDIQIFVGEVDDLADFEKFDEVEHKAHPAFKHFPGTAETRDIIFRSVDDHQVGEVFTPYWKNHCYPRLKQLEQKLK